MCIVKYISELSVCLQCRGEGDDSEVLKAARGHSVIAAR